MNNSYNDIEQIKTTIETQLKHPYLMKFIEQPVIDNDKLMLLHEVLDDTKSSVAMKRDYMVSTMLVQVALDTHEQVLTSSLHNNDEAMKSRQLTVLAGVYYSTLYYHLLAKIGDVPMIRNLAKGIREINEHKISVYQKDSGGIENLINSIREIESSLIQKTADFLKVPHIKKLAAEMCLYKRLKSERELFIKQRFSILFDAIKKEVVNGESSIARNIDEQRKHLLNICDYYIEQTQLQIEKQLEQFGFSEVLRTRINEMLFHYQYVKEKVVEEG
ncbi:heptaprenyl diphosphate synthase component 1 [Bacillus solimangrovi]|uniref:Heptaprenyl diphosphate synthase n=1 Tax=Bacillus solimangrovi TaxID=1305675 RepID=A0A1E5LHA9_9BACI|nr:heptaprenyl diphosphate synthase component 1 [Bacillus solimangrovi]OEH93457.1 hypothetical protein BFG57_00230 [Bacillus solimangrovi]